MPGAGLRASDPACLLATWFGAGWLPRAPGTWGSLAALPFAAALAWLGGPWLVLLAALALFGLGMWASERYMAAYGVHDPAAIVVDEVVGQWLTVALLPLTPLAYLVGFVLFRAADMAKPWPVGWIDRRLVGGIGVMLDDAVAAVYAGALAFAVLLWLP